jgi:multidrug efflux pump subunit AcrB
MILIGVVVNNGIVLVDHINNLRQEGLPRNEAIIEAGRDRLRPILMTVATTILGLTPLAVSTTHSRPWSRCWSYLPFMPTSIRSRPGEGRS